eukprot:7501909-Pyramimonas_sp.AAC.1
MDALFRVFSPWGSTILRLACEVRTYFKDDLPRSTSMVSSAVREGKHSYEVEYVLIKSPSGPRPRDRVPTVGYRVLPNRSMLTCVLERVLERGVHAYICVCLGADARDIVNALAADGRFTLCGVKGCRKGPSVLADTIFSEN